MRTAPGLAPELHRRASAWHREHGNVDEAIAHATAAGDYADAGELIARHWRPVWSQGQFETVARWIDALPQDAVLADARLCLARGWAALYLDQPRLSATAGGGSPSMRACRPRFRDGTTSVQEGAPILQAAHANLGGDVGGALEAARRALAHNQDAAAPSRAVANVHLGMAAYYAGELAAAEAAYEEALRSPLADEWASVRAVALGNLAAVQVESGEHRPGRADPGGGGARDRALRRARVGVRVPVLDRARQAARVARRPRGAAAAFERAVTLARRVGSQLVIAHGLLELAHARTPPRRARRGANARARGAPGARRLSRRRGPRRAALSEPSGRCR